METLDWQGWFTLGVIFLVLVAMIRGIAAPDFVMIAGLITLGLAGVLSPEETFVGFANPAMATVAALFVLSAAMRETGALEITLGRLYGKAKSELSGMVRTLPVLAGLSGFLNNAPIVAMMTPLVIDWCRRNRIAPSRVLIPLSYSTILGSSCTVIGTSVTLMVVGLVAQSDMEPMTLFEVAPVGVPITLVGLLYLIFIAPRILPERIDPASDVGNKRREYTVAMLVEDDCALIDQSIEDAGLRDLPGLFLFEIRRSDETIRNVGPSEVIHGGDHLVFAGVVSTIVDLQRIRGLVPIDDDDLPARGSSRHRLTEAVISRSSPLVNRTLKAANFRTMYNAAVIAVHRNGERVQGKLGQIVLNAGDTLVFQATSNFAERHRNSPDFYLVSEVEDSHSPEHEKAWLAIGVFALMVVLAATEVVPIAIGAFVASGILMTMRCITGQMARKSVQLHVLVVIAAGLGIASAIEKTGAATAIAHLLVSQSEAFGALAILATVYLLTNVMAEMLHHNASAAIMFPIAVAAANEAGVDPRSFIIAVTLGAQLSFSSPVAYQTHLLVYGPGGYRFTDFVKVGLPLNLICAAIALYVIPIVWPF
ncbi:MAG: SLC13 family permease [Myxococcota bacterium]|jgi:di/tricarboxylate transporter|nr:SLC13 family permease [Myxococcota bacterium]